MPPPIPPTQITEASASSIAPVVPDEVTAEPTREAIRFAVEQAVASALSWQRQAEARIARAELDLAVLRASDAIRTPEPPPAVLPPPLPVQAAAALAVATAVPVVARPPPLPSIDDVPFDIEMLPEALNGGRRKRKLAWGALILLLLGLGTLFELAIASQAKHGL
jgi:hypothetical protein